MKRSSRRFIRENIIGLLFILATAVFLFWFFLWRGGGGSAMPTSQLDNLNSVIRYPSRLNGEGTGSPDSFLPVAVMIDNHPDSYPPSGLAEARVVYEAPVEGTFTRYMAVFDSNQQIEKAGPVRSSRPYYLDWAAEYDGSLYMYCGGSPAALRQIADSGIFAADQFYNDRYFWRDDGRFAPYNLYTKADLWNGFIADKKKDNGGVDWDGWKFSADCTLASSTYSNGVNIVFNSDYSVSWRYNTGDNVYERSVNGQMYFDDKNFNLTASNIAVQFTKMKVIDEIGRKEIATMGTGDAIFVRCGRAARAVWKKDSAAGRTRFYDAGGEEISFVPGKIWVEVAPIGAEVEFTN